MENNQKGDALPVEPEITEKQAILFLINNGWLVNHDKELREKWEKPQGEWIGHIQYCKQHNLIPTGYKLFVWCNRCNCPNEKKTKFCPNCGADMQKR